MIQYSTSIKSDPHSLFHVDDEGVVSLQRHLDREISDRHDIEILVSDKGTPRLTLTATLVITVTDVNDNPPFISALSADELSNDSRHPFSTQIIIPENSFPRDVAELTLDDPDDWSLGHGPPFKMEIDPAAPQYLRESFDLKFFKGIVVLF